MPDGNHGYDEPAIIDLVDNPVIADADAPGIASFEFLAAGRPGILHYHL